VTDQAGGRDELRRECAEFHRCLPEINGETVAHEPPRVPSAGVVRQGASRGDGSTRTGTYTVRFRIDDHN